MNQEYEELKEPDSGGGLVNMISKGIGLFFGRQSETKGSQSEINEDWPPKPSTKINDIKSYSMTGV